MRLRWTLVRLRQFISVTKGRVELPRHLRHDVLSVACLPVAPLGRKSSSDPCGNRTRPCGLRGRRPEPIDERAVAVRRAGVEPAMPEGGWVTATWAHQCPADATCQAGGCGRETGGRMTRPATALSNCLPPASGLRPPACSQASPAGFEPAISTLTGWRALQAAPRGRKYSVVQVEVEPGTAAISRGRLQRPTTSLRPVPGWLAVTPHQLVSHACVSSSYGS